MYQFLCMRVYIYVRMIQIHTNAHKHTHAHAIQTHTHTHTYTYTYKYAYMYTYTHVRVYIDRERTSARGMCAHNTCINCTQPKAQTLANFCSSSILMAAFIFFSAKTTTSLRATRIFLIWFAGSSSISSAVSRSLRAYDVCTYVYVCHFGHLYDVRYIRVLIYVFCVVRVLSLVC